MNAAERRGATGRPKRPKRIITDARKEQNRVAQKLFRQRQKERAESRELPRNDLPGKQRPLKPRQTDAILPEAGKSFGTSAAGTTVAAEQLQTSLDAPERSSTNEIGLDVSQPFNSDFLVPETIPGNEWNDEEMLSLSMSSDPFFSGPDMGMIVNYKPQTPPAIPDAEELVLPSSLSVSKSFDIFMANQPPLTTEELNSPALLELASQICYTRQHEILGQKLQLATSIVVGESGGSQNMSIDAPLNRIPGVEVFVSAVTEFLYGKPGYGCHPITSLPDPYRNALECPQTATLVAYLHNARCIGLDMQDLLVHESPFYNQTTTASDDPQALLTAAQKPWIPMHLQPTLPQVLMQHHPWLDVLPFPALRARAIMLGASTPQLYHPMELKKDIFSGIYCQRHGDRTGSGQPWDMGSWKATPWFLKKWRLLIG